MAKYGEFTPQCQTTVLPITGERLQETIRRWDSQASAEEQMVGAEAVHTRHVGTLG